jgi:hypothetical protein
MHGILSRSVGGNTKAENITHENSTWNVKCTICIVRYTKLYTHKQHSNTSPTCAHVCFVSLSVAVKFERQTAQQPAKLAQCTALYYWHHSTTAHSYVLMCLLYICTNTAKVRFECNYRSSTALFHASYALRIITVGSIISTPLSTTALTACMHAVFTYGIAWSAPVPPVQSKVTKFS